MGKRIVAFALTGWAAIIALAWWLADQRIGLCKAMTYSAETRCQVAATAARDFILIFGLTAALVFLVIVAALWARRSGRLSQWSLSATRERLLDRQ